MSYPWFHFKVTTLEGEVTEGDATGMTPFHALLEYLNVYVETGEYPDITRIEWVDATPGYEEFAPDHMRTRYSRVLILSDTPMIAEEQPTDADPEAYLPPF